MDFRDIIDLLVPNRGRLVGLVLVATGVLLILVAWGAQSNIDEIGETTDPILQHRIATLEDERDLYFMTGVGVLFAGFFTVTLLGSPSMPTSVSESQMVSSARMTTSMFKGLSLAGNASYLPKGRGLTEERVFVSSSRTSPQPPSAISDDMILSPGKDGSSPGILLEPSGLRLLDSIEEDLDLTIDGVGIEAAEGALQYLKHSLGMMKDFHFKEREGKTVLRVEYSGLREACRTVRKERPDTCRQVACAGCACLLTAAARATGKRVVVEEVDNGKDPVVFTLSLADW